MSVRTIKYLAIHYEKGPGTLSGSVLEYFAKNQANFFRNGGEWDSTRVLSQHRLFSLGGQKRARVLFQLGTNVRTCLRYDGISTWINSSSKKEEDEEEDEESA
eukprot:Lithocolla_globosa_v1_NODE_579_length_3692_cov_95.718999.p3 type:complete len:103 gc:universal NODE_579_length_3692_cov_95.718999:2120-2428(+)